MNFPNYQSGTHPLSHPHPHPYPLENSQQQTNPAPQAPPPPPPPPPPRQLSQHLPQHLPPQQQHPVYLTNGSGVMQSNGGGAGGGGMPVGPTPAGHQAELNIIYGMVEELSRQLTENRRVTEDIVSGLGRVRNRARERGLTNDQVLDEAANEIFGTFNSLSLSPLSVSLSSLPLSPPLSPPCSPKTKLTISP